MSLKTHQFKEEYRTGQDQIINDFYHPALNLSNQYWRAVGYFSSSVFEAIGLPLGEFVYRQGLMKLITSVELREHDVEVLQNGFNKVEFFEEYLLAKIKTQFADPLGKGASLLLQLLEAGSLEIQIAVPQSKFGIYHEKVGIFIDESNNFVTFSGSLNESRNALMGNYECVDVYTSWNDIARASQKRTHFEKLWNNNTPGVDVMPFPEAAKKELIRIAKQNNKSKIKETEDNLWTHQKEAVKAFFDSKRGVLEMATGTGKTYTSIHIVEKLANSKKINSVIVSSNGTDLLDQWTKQLYVLATELTPRYRVLKHFGVHHDREEYVMDSENSILVISRGALHPVLSELTTEQKRGLIIIHDEVHGLGSSSNIENLSGLSDDIEYRLGLSATPEREYDEEGNEFITENVGPVIYRFSLEDAIRRGILCEFDYHPLEYNLSDDDRQRLQSVYRQKTARSLEGKPMSDSEFWTALARVYKTSIEKIPVFQEFLKQNPEVLQRSLIFVAEKEYGENILPIIHNYIYDFHTYFAEDDRENLVLFAGGNISCLITCHRLSEGIDVKSIKSIILFASDRARLETIQRIGRCLRIDKNEPEKRAAVIDFIRAQDHDKTELNTDQIRRRWLESISDVKRES